jgi:uroporphyrinogen-III synthase
VADFRGARIAVLESRYREDTANLVRRMGGVPLSAPALQEVPRPIPDLCADFIPRLAGAKRAVAVCLTGAGLRALFAQAADQGCDGALRQALAAATTVCRGPKPAGVLAAEGIPVSLRAAEPFTTAEVIQALEPLDLRDRFAALVHYGETNDWLSGWLLARGAALYELLPYEWRLPEDTGPIDRLVDEILRGGVHAVAFTSQVQVRHLVQVAGDTRVRALLDALGGPVRTAAIGPTCAAALEAAGVRPTIVASPPKLGPMLASLANALQDHSIP